jgi:hypothetical protein
MFRERVSEPHESCGTQKSSEEIYQNHFCLTEPKIDRHESAEPLKFRKTPIFFSVIPFFHDPTNVLDMNEVIFLHDKAPCLKANATQQFVEGEGMKFWGNWIWPGNSADMNPAENIGAIIKDKVEELVASEDRKDRYNYDILKINVENTLKNLDNDTDLFIDLLCSRRKRFDALKAAGGGHTNF